MSLPHLATALGLTLLAATAFAQPGEGFQPWPGSAASADAGTPDGGAQAWLPFPQQQGAASPAEESGPRPAEHEPAARRDQPLSVPPSATPAASGPGLTPILTPVIVSPGLTIGSGSVSGVRDGVRLEVKSPGDARGAGSGRAPLSRGGSLTQPPEVVDEREGASLVETSPVAPDLAETPVASPAPERAQQAEVTAAAAPSLTAPPVDPTPVKKRNAVSLFGARPLGAGATALGVSIGFPLLRARVAHGLSDALDLGVGFDSFYGVMNEPRFFGRLLLKGSERFHLAAKLEAGWATFLQAPNAEGTGARWITGRRNYNLAPGLVFSFDGIAPRSARFFFDLSAHAAFDTQPYQSSPLEGIPSFVQVSVNVPIRGGVEVPLSEATSFLVDVGFDIHGRRDDSPFMPSLAVGLLTGL